MNRSPGSACVLLGLVPIGVPSIGRACAQGHLSVPVTKKAEGVERLGFEDSFGLKEHGRNSIVRAKVAINGSSCGHSEREDLSLFVSGSSSLAYIAPA